MDKIASEHSIWIQAPRKQVWQALTLPEQLTQWFVPNLPGVDIRRDEHGKLSIYFGEMGVDFVRMDEKVPLEQVTMRSLPERMLTITYTLTDEQDRTLVKVMLTGFDFCQNPPVSIACNLSSQDEIIR